MKSRSAALIFVAGLITASCSEKLNQDPNKPETSSELVRRSEAETAQREGERQPPADQIAEDCVALVASTKVFPARAPKAECPVCPAGGGTNAVTLRQIKPGTISCSTESCLVVVTIHAVFNSGAGETIEGGLTAWIPSEQRSAYLRGQMPPGEQAYRVQITYQHRDGLWRAVDFDRAPNE